MVFLSGDDAPAKQEVATLIDRLGLAPIDLADFEMGRRLQQFPSGPLAGRNAVQLP
jgi:predicted dinucleotide-binding enzyme